MSHKVCKIVLENRLERLMFKKEERESEGKGKEIESGIEGQIES